MSKVEKIQGKAEGFQVLKVELQAIASRVAQRRLRPIGAVVGRGLESSERSFGTFGKRFTFSNSGFAVWC
jgi:hypothetical protein